MTPETCSQEGRSILFTHRDIGNIDRGGVCVLFKALSSGLSKRNWKVHVATAQELTMEGVETHMIDPIDDPREYSKAVTEVVEAVKPDIAESSTWRAELLHYSEHPIRSSRVVVRAEPSASTLFSNVDALTEGERLLCTKADLILAVSNFAKRDIETKYNPKGVKVVYNGIEDNKGLFHTRTITSGEIINPFTQEGTPITDLPLDYLVQTDKINVIWIGKPTKMKGFDLLERIVANTPENVSFIINTGYAPAEVVWNPENYKKCTFIRALTKQDQLSVLRQSSVFLSTSSAEGFGIAVAEALSEGLPVILNTDCVVFHEFLPNEAVGLVNMQDSDSVAKAISDSNNKKVSYSRNPDRFTQQQMIEDSITQYKLLLGIS